MRLIALPVALLGLSLAGCGSVTPVPTTVETTGLPNPENALQASMRHVDAEMAQLGGMGPPPTRASAPPMPAELTRTVSFDWSGPLDKGVAKLAASVGYTFYTSGPPGFSPVPVTVRLEAAPVYQVFQALGEQAGTNATVELDPLHHQVQVVHHG